jgi:hypothetical protein
MATLKVKIQEDIILDNQDYGSKRVLEISSIANITKKIVSIAGDDDATVLVFKSTTASADGALDLQTVKYIRITNLDSSNSVNISLQLDSGEDNSAADLSITHLLEAGRSFLMGAPDEGAHTDDDSASIVTALTDLESIIVDPGSNSGQVEVFVAST